MKEEITLKKHGELHSVELIGGNTRLLSIKQATTDVFGSFMETLDKAEAVCKGAAVGCAMESPCYNVSPFKIID